MLVSATENIKVRFSNTALLTPILIKISLKAMCVWVKADDGSEKIVGQVSGPPLLAASLIRHFKGDVAETELWGWFRVCLSGVGWMMCHSQPQPHVIHLFG